MEYHKVTNQLVNIVREASTATQVKLYRKLSIKKRIASLNIYFNSMCLRQNLTPSYVNITTTSRSPASMHAVRKASSEWIRRELRKWYGIRDSISYYLFVLHVELTHSLYNVEWSAIDDYVRQLSSVAAFKKREILNRKLLRLKGRTTAAIDDVNDTPPCHKFHQRVLNLSHHKFQVEEMDVLSKGLKYAPPIPISRSDLEIFS